jgi:inosine-uridine nucleoside N-ribohydrolase
MPRKVIIDCDPGIDDAIAVALALFDPRLEVVAVTATAGNVPADQATRNVQTVIDQLDPPRLPRIGAASEIQGAPPIDGSHLHGADGLGNTNFPYSELHHQHPSEKVICDLVRNSPGEVSIIALGPLTNIARAFRLDPELPMQIDRLILRGGAVDGIGDVTAAAEFNFYFNPLAARSVIRSRTTKTLVPLDVTRRIAFSLDLLQQLPDGSSRVGRLVQAIVPYLFRSYRQELGQESIHLPEVVALVAATDPHLFETQELSGDVETQGDVTIGATVFDRRASRGVHSDIEVALDVDVTGIHRAILERLAEAARATM